MEPSQDSAFPQLREALNTNGFTRRLQRELQHAEPNRALAAVRVRRHYYEPGKACRLLVEAQLRSAGGVARPQLYFGEMFAAGDFEAAVRQVPVRPAAILQRESLILWAFPSDPYVPGIAVLADPGAMRTRIQNDPSSFGLPSDATIENVAIRLAKYVPGKRCSFMYRVLWRGHGRATAEHRFFGKTYLEGRAGPACEIMRRIESSAECRTGRLRIPHTYGHDRSLEAVWQEVVPGTPQSKSADLEDLRAAAGSVGAALAALHVSDVALGPGKGMSKQLHDLGQAAKRIATAYPEFASHCDKLVDRLVRGAPFLPDPVIAPVHGSFKSGHILVDQGRVAIIDFDGAGLGDPVYDVGRYMARLDLAGSKSAAARSIVEETTARFRDSYASAVPWGWSDLRARWYTSAHLVASQAQKNVKRMSPRRVLATLQRAETWFPADLIAR